MTTHSTSTIEASTAGEAALGSDASPMAGLSMPLVNAMETQRAIRRLHPDPVDDELILRCIELATKAPTGSNTQTWEWVVVRDPSVKAKLAGWNRLAWRFYGPLLGRLGGADRTSGMVSAGQWQARHFEEIPVIVIACLRGPRPLVPAVATASYYASIYPSVQNFLLACRALGLGAALTTMPIWRTRSVRRALGLPRSVRPCAAIPVGWPRGRYGPTTRKPVEEVVHLDRWSRHAA